MKKRILSFLLVLVLLFNALAVTSFAMVGEQAENGGTAQSDTYVPLTPEKTLEEVTEDNFMTLLDFSSTSTTNYPSHWVDGRTYYEKAGTEITDETRLANIKAVLEKFGKRMSYSASSTALAGKNMSTINNAGVMNLKEDGDNKYIAMTSPFTYEDYEAIVGVYYKNTANKNTYLVRDSDKYKNAVHTNIDFYSSSDIASLIEAGNYNRRFAMSVDLMAGNLKVDKTFSLFAISNFYLDSTSAVKHSDVTIMRLNVTADGEYTVEYRKYNKEGTIGSWETLPVELSDTEFTRITVLIDPADNTYDVMADGVVLVEDSGFLETAELNRRYSVGDEKVYIPSRSRSFNIGFDANNPNFEFIGDGTAYSIDNYMIYCTDKFIECAHKYVADSDFCSKCEQCGDTKACFDEGVDHIYTNGKFDDRINLETYYDTAEDKANKTNPHKRLKIGVSKTYIGDDFILNLNNRMGMYDFNGDDLIIGAPVSEDYYKVNVGDSSQKNEVYLVYKNEELQSIKDTDDAVIAEAVNKYKGASFIISGSIKGAPTSGLAEGVSELSIGLLTAHCFRFATKSDSLTGFYLVDLVVTEDENGSPVYTLKTNKEISSDGKPHTIGTVSTEDYTDIAAFVDPKTNSVEIYLNGERVLADKEFVFIKDGEGNTAWTTYMKCDKYGLNKPEDFMLTATKICAISSGNYSNVTGDMLYVDRFDIAYADSYTENVTTYKDGCCDKCGKVMLDVEERNVSLGTSITLNYYVDVADAILNNAVVTLTNGSRTVTLAAAEGEEYKFSMRKYSFDMTSIDMTKPVNIRVSVGENASAVYTSSVVEYALALIADESETDEAKTLAKAMLNYGAAAQIYFAELNAKPEIAKNLANAGLDIADTVIPEVDATTLPEPSGTYLLPRYTSLILEGKLRLRIYYPGNGEGYTATVTATKNDSTESITVGEFLIDASDNLFAITIEDIVPTDYDAVYTVTLSCEGYTEEATLEISVNAVIGMILDNDTLSDNYKALAKALYDYHVKALAYEGV